MAVICRPTLPHSQHLAALHFQRQTRTWSEPSCRYTAALLHKAILRFAFLAPRSWTVSSLQSRALRLRHLALRLWWNLLNFVPHCQNPVPQFFHHCRVTAPLWRTATRPICLRTRQQTPWGLPACFQVYFLCHARILVPQKLVLLSNSRAPIWHASLILWRTRPSSSVCLNRATQLMQLALSRAGGLEKGGGSNKWPTLLGISLRRLKRSLFPM